MGRVIQFRKPTEAASKQIHEPHFVDQIMYTEEVMAIQTVSSMKFAECEFETDMIGWFSLKNISESLAIVAENIRQGEYTDSPEIMFYSHIFEIESLFRIFSDMQIVAGLSPEQSFYIKRYTKRLAEMVSVLSEELRRFDNLAMLDKLNIMLGEWKKIQEKYGINSRDNLQ